MCRLVTVSGRFSNGGGGSGGYEGWRTARYGLC
jgi:hypothetical protein